MFETSCVNTKNNTNIEIPFKIEWSVSAVLPALNCIDNLGLAGPVVGVVNNHLIVAGGANFPDGFPWYGNKKEYHDIIYCFSRFKTKIDNGAIIKTTLPHPVAYCASINVPNGLIYLGGENEKGISDEVVFVKFNEEGHVIKFYSLPSLPKPLTNLSAVFYDQTIYVAGGVSIDGTSDNFYSLKINESNKKWVMLPKIPVKISNSIIIEQLNGENHFIYLIGGRRKNSDSRSDIFSTVYCYDIINKKWLQKSSLPFGISAGTGMALENNQIILIGGDKGETFSKEEKLNIALKSANDSNTIHKLTQHRITLLENHPGFSQDVLIYDTKKDEWKKTGVLPSPSPVTTTALKWKGDIIIPSGEIRAGVRTPNILVGKIKKYN